MLHLGCCSSPRSASVLVDLQIMKILQRNLITYAASTLNVISLFAKLATTPAALAKVIAAGVVRATGTVGLHIAGIVISALLIPVDLIQLIVSSVKLHRRSKSEVVINTEKIELWFLLKDKRAI